jgi:Bacteriophage protein of unknown function (DUF646).
VARKAKFRGDYEGIGEILRSPQMQAEMRSRGEQVQARAEFLAPEETGAYKSSFKVEVGIREGKTRRAEAKVINDDEAAPYVEYGTSKTPRYRVMGQAAGSA